MQQIVLENREEFDSLTPEILSETIKNIGKIFGHLDEDLTSIRKTLFDQILPFFIKSVEQVGKDYQFSLQ